MLIPAVSFFGLLTALLAARKGYNPLCWFFAGGVIGLIFLAFRPFINRRELSERERAALKEKGDRVGLIVSCVVLGLGLFLTVLSLALAKS